MSEFTKGPWVVDKGEGWAEDYPRRTTVSASWPKPINGILGYQVCRLSGVNDRTMANAHLIAAAPELYQSLKEVMAGTYREGQHTDCTDCNFKRALAAIAKAEGRL